jgi:tRNA (cytidine/uridine-2'-O-)-methyltransferase
MELTSNQLNGIDLAMFQPEIPQNVGTMLRMCACFGVAVDVIEPTGFPWDDSRMRRAGMDYIALANVTKYQSFTDFCRAKKGRVILLDVKATDSLCDFKFLHGDTIMVGRESCGVPDEIFNTCDERVKIPMLDGRRSLNVAISAAIAVWEAMRQLTS